MGPKGLEAVRLSERDQDVLFWELLRRDEQLKQSLLKPELVLPELAQGLNLQKEEKRQRNLKRCVHILTPSSASTARCWGSTALSTRRWRSVMMMRLDCFG